MKTAKMNTRHYQKKQVAVKSPEKLANLNNVIKQSGISNMTIAISKKDTAIGIELKCDYYTYDETLCLCIRSNKSTDTISFDILPSDHAQLESLSSNELIEWINTKLMAANSRMFLYGDTQQQYRSQSAITVRLQPIISTVKDSALAAKDQEIAIKSNGVIRIIDSNEGPQIIVQDPKTQTLLFSEPWSEAQYTSRLEELEKCSFTHDRPPLIYGPFFKRSEHGLITAAYPIPNKKEQKYVKKLNEQMMHMLHNQTKDNMPIFKLAFSPSNGIYNYAHHSHSLHRRPILTLEYDQKVFNVGPLHFFYAEDINCGPLDCINPLSNTHFDPIIDGCLGSYTDSTFSETQNIMEAWLTGSAIELTTIIRPSQTFGLCSDETQYSDIESNAAVAPSDASSTDSLESTPPAESEFSFFNPWTWGTLFPSSTEEDEITSSTSTERSNEIEIEINQDSSSETTQFDPEVYVVQLSDGELKIKPLSEIDRT